MKPKKAFILLSLFIAALVVSACGKSQSQESGAPPAPTVSVAAVIQKEVNEWDEFTGRLEAVEHVDIRPRVSGYVDKIYFRQGAEVKKGDLLFEIVDAATTEGRAP